MPNRYGTFCWIRYSAISSPPFILAMTTLPFGTGEPRFPRYPFLRQRECDDALFGHFVHSIARALAPEAAVFRAAVGHQVDSRAGSLVDMHAADLEPLRRGERIVQPVGEDAGGQAVGRRID